MVRALAVRTNLIDRHFLLQSIVKESYKRRTDPRMKELCLEVGRLHLREFPGIAPALAAEMGGSLPTVPSFKWLVTVLAEEDRFEEAVSVCEAAARMGLSDGTGSGYAGRAERVRSTLAKKKS